MMSCVARKSGTSTSPSASAAGTAAAPGAGLSPPPAVRAHAPGWRDPRLWIGVVLVACSVVVGARVLAAADDTVAVWAVASDMGAGDEVRAADLVASRVRFADQTDLAAYFVADEELPAALELLRGVGAGELLPRAAAGRAGENGTVEVPVAVDSAQVPPAVRAGSVVDVYVLATAPSARADGDGGLGRRASGRAPVLDGVTVVDAPSAAETLGAGGERQLVLAVAADDVGAFFGLLGALETPSLTVVRRG